MYTSSRTFEKLDKEMDEAKLRTTLVPRLIMVVFTSASLLSENDAWKAVYEIQSVRFTKCNDKIYFVVNVTRVTHR